ncbi:hypothetical protein GCM10011357_15710 [Lacimicrobium alkaliphilum]|uniref:Uncharacterized protein n=1 Tax=Lacimicrobium alkaliphilum TaxID=1526571 RepID=A0ABQ1RA74_9ALTE|nr:hypothetical protein GCM10011357_15710 [Lacimicrobium alkaliphilum]
MRNVKITPPVNNAAANKPLSRTSNDGIDRADDVASLSGPPETSISAANSDDGKISATLKISASGTDAMVYIGIICQGTNQQSTAATRSFRLIFTGPLLSIRDAHSALKVIIKLVNK